MTNGSASNTTTRRLASVLKRCRDIMRKDKGLNGDLDRLPQLTWVLFLKFLDDLEQQDEALARIEGDDYRPLIPPPYRWRDWAAPSDGITGDELTSFVNNDEAILPVVGPNGDPVRGPGLFATLRALEGREGGDRRDVIARVFRGTSNRMLNGYLLRDVVNKVDEIHFTASEELHTLSRLYEGLLRDMRDAAGDSGEFYTPRALVQMIVQVMNPQLGEKVLDPACGTGGFLVEAFDHMKQQVQNRDQRLLLQRDSLFGAEAKSLPYLLGEMNLLLHGVEVPNVAYGNSLAVNLNEIGDRERVDVVLSNPPFGGEEEDGIKAGFPADRQTSETALLFLQLIMRRLRRARGAARGGRAAVVVPNGTLYESGIAAELRRELIDRFGLHTVIRLPKGVFEPYTDIATNVLFFEHGTQVEKVWFYQHPLPPHRAHLKGQCYSATDGLKFEEFERLFEWWNNREETDFAWSVDVGKLADDGYDLALTHPRKQGVVLDPPSVVVRRAKEHLVAVARKVDELAALAASLEGVSGNQVRLGELITPRADRMTVQPGVAYKRVRVQLHFRGATLRDEVDGGKIGTKRQTFVRTNDLIMSKIDARNGAMAIIPGSLDGAIATNDFPVFEIDSSRVLPQYLRFALFQPTMLRVYQRLSRGSTNRRRIQVDKFLDLKIPVPDLDAQAEVTEALEQCEASLREVGDHMSDAGEELESVLASTIMAAFRREGE